MRGRFLFVSDLPMTPSSLVIVTDRGSLKAYQVTETPTRGPSLQLVQAFNITDAHGRLVDKLSDVAGGVPISHGCGWRPWSADISGRTRFTYQIEMPNSIEVGGTIKSTTSHNRKIC